MSGSIRVACVQLEAHEVSNADRALEEAVDAASRAAPDADVVVLSEASYPGYVIHEKGPYLDLTWYERGCKAFAQVALEHRAWIAVGLVRPVSGQLRNSAVLLDPLGKVARVTDKSFLWHFDSRWFESGEPGDPVALGTLQAGTFVCADGRMMEVPRCLSIAGARLLLDPAALVLAPSGVNAQIEYMLAARAWENGAYLAVANKCGVEAGIAHYAGRSTVYGPDGDKLAEGAPDRSCVVVADIAPSSATGPPVARGTNYPQLTAPIESLGIAEVLRHPPPARPLRVGFVQESREDVARMLDELGADLAVGPITTTAARIPTLVPADDGFLLQGRQVRSGETFDLGSVRVGILAGDRGCVPEEVRALMLDGASIVAWSVTDFLPPIEVLRTRADENRVFLLAVRRDGHWRAFSPAGAELGRGPGSNVAVVLVEMTLALAWDKEMAPGTDVVRGRSPEKYRQLG